MCRGSAAEVSKGEEIGREEERCSQARMEEPKGRGIPIVWQVGDGAPGHQQEVSKRVQESGLGD